MPMSERQRRYRSRERVEEAERHFKALEDLHQTSKVLRAVLGAARIVPEVIDEKVKNLESAERSTEARAAHMRNGRS